MGDLAPPRRLPPDLRKETLLRAAEETFAEHGFEGARLDDIAQAAGVTKAIVYRHFASKDDLFGAAVREACRSLEASMESALREGGPLDALVARCLRVWFDFVAERQSGFALVASHRPGTEVAVELVDATRNRIVQQIADALPWHMPGVDPSEARRIGEGLVRAIVGAAEAVADWWAQTKPYPIDVAWLTVMNLNWLGIDRLIKGELWLPGAPDAGPQSS